MKQLSLTTLAIAIAILLGACAASEPQPTVPVAAAESTTVTAEDGQAVPSGQAKLETPDDLVCRYEKRPGSNFREKVCRTAAAIAARAEEDQAAMRQMRAIRSGSQEDMQGVRPSGIGN